MFGIKISQLSASTGQIVIAMSSIPLLRSATYDLLHLVEFFRDVGGAVSGVLIAGSHPPISPHTQSKRRLIPVSHCRVRLSTSEC